MTNQQNKLHGSWLCYLQATILIVKGCLYEAFTFQKDTAMDDIFVRFDSISKRKIIIITLIYSWQQNIQTFESNKNIKP